jgi:hypothetical protein
MCVLLNTERLAREGTSLSTSTQRTHADDARAVVRAVEKAASLG